MDTETLFTATKWEILKLLEEKPFAPIELAEKLGSSLGNVSQQLKLLELAGVITSTRIPNRERGQPRMMYKLAGNLSYMISTSEQFVDKKVVQLSPRNKAVLRIWFLEDPQIRYALEKAFWKLEPHLEKVQQLTYAGLEQGIPVIEAQSTKKMPTVISLDGEFKNVNVRTVEEPVGYVLYTEE